MRIHNYKLTFLTPAFLGNAAQQAQWRTPPIKALLRQYWRMAWASENPKGTVQEMRYAEGKLFGNAWLSRQENGKTVNEHSKSLVRLRLLNTDRQTPWALGTQTGVSPLPVGIDTSYAWFGLIKRRGEPDRTAIKADVPESEQRLSIAAPEGAWSLLEQALTLAHAFGALGSRSRGGWGSLHIDGSPGLSIQEMKKYARPLRECLQHDWARSVALLDESLCVWESKKRFKTWDEAMTIVATERRHVRSTLDRDLRAALGFAGKGRMPSPLRWKVLRHPAGGLFIRIAAMPHDIPSDSNHRLASGQLDQAWRQIIQTLDSDQHFKQIEAEQ
ncbi:hypothetical protein EBQ25_01520 [Allofranklinella schreckenbergeri]|uniref:CRISPR type III-associated protein domain-containing protein n=1 Tax=Allofranklinella schreckenbergeri TaxID=1076744 RepID=A0A3M6QHM2_9BURK|nr:RAMP superfamily CRISPR-associated protein [Allofranklinella schreckenbergeri]RMX01959.1 hypothetical protein EBQ25_01520 [Allofranklinella schreckenbergeri]